MTHELLASCERALDERFVVHRLYEQKDPTAYLTEISADIRAIAGGKVGPQMMDVLPNLKMISNFGVGYDTIDIDAARDRNISVTNTPNVLNEAMAEITLGLMIALARRIPQADQYLRAGKWPDASFPLQSQLSGKTVGIVGLGRIGKEIADRCQAMKMRIVYFGRRQQPNMPYIYYNKLEDMARDVDWLVAITPGGAGTDKLISRTVLTALGEKGHFVNVARGSVADETAMIELLQAGKLGGAALDVLENEPQVPEALRVLDNVVLSPHQGSATHQTRDAMGALVVANLDAFFADEPLHTPVV